jgi:hypothetical protein
MGIRRFVSSITTNKKRLHGIIIVASVPILAFFESMSIRIFHSPWAASILTISWFVYGAWFMVVYRQLMPK